jgi:23S rRNA (uracil1939-C5)-methyltransferase
MKQFIELTAGKPVYGGKCLSEYQGKIVMLEKALPGEKVRAFVKKRRSGYIEAQAAEIIERSPFRKESGCKYYPVCGGCKLRDVQYDHQAYIKEEVVKDCITRIGKVRDFEFFPLIKCSCYDHYRNKMEFTFSEERYYTDISEETDTDRFSVGLHAPKFFSKVIDMEKCMLQPEVMDNIYYRLREILKSSGMKAYNNREHTGFLRHLVLRITGSGEVMINLVTKSKDIPPVKKAADLIISEFPQIRSFVNTVNTKAANIAFGDEIITIAGTPYLIDTIGSLKFEISSNSFFQVNPEQTPRLYDIIAEFSELKGDESVLDLYCGVGTISLYLAKSAAKVTGFELVENAVENALKNAVINSITNCEFISGDMMKLAKDGDIFKEKYDIIITDPPRDGMHPKVVESIIRSNVPRIVYVSCNPSTFARDVKLLEEGGYKLLKVQPVDMFPQTYHVETAGLLAKV